MATFGWLNETTEPNIDSAAELVAGLAELPIEPQALQKLLGCSTEMDQGLGLTAFGAEASLCHLPRTTAVDHFQCDRRIAARGRGPEFDFGFGRACRALL